jgi:hypothetical protein
LAMLRDLYPYHGYCYRAEAYAWHCQRGGLVVLYF